MTVFLRLNELSDKQSALCAADSGQGQRFVLDYMAFRRLPGSPFAYWLPPSLLDVFGRHAPLHGGTGFVWSTNPLNDDFRFARCAWEVDARTKRSRWWPWAKGGDYARIYQDREMVICFDREAQVYPGFLGTPSRPISRPASVQHFFLPGLTWSRRSQRGLSVRALPADCVFGDKGPFIGNPDEAVLLALLAITNSSTFRALVRAQMAFGSFEVGVLQRTPVPSNLGGYQFRLADLSREAWAVARSVDTCNEVSHAYELPSALSVRADSLRDGVDKWSEQSTRSSWRLDAIMREIDELTLDLYGIHPRDRNRVGEADRAESEVGAAQVSVEADRAAADLVSWCVGVAVGRFDVRLATGARTRPEIPAPFDPLPVCSPGMLTNERGLPLESLPPGYPVEVSHVLVDDPGHGVDIAARVRSVFDVVFGDDADRWWSEVGDALSAPGREVAPWLSNGFFDYHLRTYSKSRRKAPIYWPFGTVSGSYSVWISAHQATSDSLYRVLQDQVSPKLLLERRRLSELVQEAGPNPSASQRKTIDAQEEFVGELEGFVEDLSAVAPLLHPSLNDGIVVVLAPLWRLFVHHKGWAKELRKHWDNLSAGEYDWAHLAMRLWPERVVPKCAADRSLAISHGLEDVFWIQDENNSDEWHPRQTPKVAIDELIAERTATAIKAALDEDVDR